MADSAVSFVETEKPQSSVTPVVLKSYKDRSVGGVSDWKNLIIHGDNASVMTTLMGGGYNLRGSVDLMLWDAPYNTGSDGFVYGDNRLLTGKEARESDSSRHKRWLNFMGLRLKLAKKLMKPSGVIAIHISDHEQANLQLLMDEVFGEDNRLPTLIWDMGTGATAGVFRGVHEYILVYSKDISKFKPTSLGKRTLSHGALKKPSRNNPLSTITFPAGIRYQGQNARFTGRIGGSEWVDIQGEMVFEDGKLKFPVTLSAGWAMKRQILSWLLDEPTEDTKGQTIKEFFFNPSGILWYTKEGDDPALPTVLREYKGEPLGSTKTGNSLVESIVGNEVFREGNPNTTPTWKPVELIKLLISYLCPPDGIVLDAFAGSGTTGHAVLQLNAEQAATRRFILIEILRYAHPGTAERIRRVISGDWLSGKKDPVPGDFLFLEAQQPIDASSISIASRDIVRDIIFTIEPRAESLSSSFQYLIGKNPDGGSIALVWDYEKGSPGALTMEAYLKLHDEVEQAGTKFPVHVYADGNESPYNNPSIEYTEVSETLLGSFGVRR